LVSQYGPKGVGVTPSRLLCAVAGHTVSNVRVVCRARGPLGPLTVREEVQRVYSSAYFLGWRSSGNWAGDWAGDMVGHGAYSFLY
jgi:hypothetical protein